MSEIIQGEKWIGTKEAAEYLGVHQASLIENSHFVQEQDLEQIMEQQKIKYTCPKCGGSISIHDRECSECQEKMR